MIAVPDGPPRKAVARRQSSPVTGKRSARPAGKPGSLSSRTVCDDASWSTVSVLARILRRPSMRFLRHDRIYQSDVGLFFPSLDRDRRLPPVGPGRKLTGARREDRALLIVSMSSGRLFLDRVARQQSPSPLHRHAQIITCSSEARAKDDISTLPGTRHFYFALTATGTDLTTPFRFRYSKRV
jgi:hypothetical protein